MMAPHRQTRIVVLLVCFAVQIPVMLLLMLFGLASSYGILVLLIPAIGLVWAIFEKIRDP